MYKDNYKQYPILEKKYSYALLFTPGGAFSLEIFPLGVNFPRKYSPGGGGGGGGGGNFLVKPRKFPPPGGIFSRGGRFCGTREIHPLDPQPHRHSLLVPSRQPILGYTCYL